MYDTRVRSKPWRSLLVGDKPWVIYVRQWIRKLDGFVIPDKRKMYLRGGQDVDEWADSLLHETLHAAIAESFTDTLIRRWSQSDSQAYHREERLVRKLTPVLLVALKDLGWTPPRMEDDE